MDSGPACLRTHPGMTKHEIFVRRRLNQQGSVSGHLTGTKLPRVNSFHERTRPMKFLAASALALGLSLAAISASQAMPLAPLAQDQALSGEIIHVSGGCGFYGHR